jgi:hypothetical protein
VENEEAVFKVGEDEKPVTVEMNEDGSDAKTDEESNAKLDVSVDEKPKENVQKTQQDSELEDYSDKVKKRIDKMTARMREAERREQAAMEYAKNVQAEQEELKKRYISVDEGRVNEKAREEGDVDTETEAQEKLMGIMYEQRKLVDEEPQRKAYVDRIQKPTPQKEQEPTYDPKAEKWAEENEWFGKDTVMTHAAMGLHKELVMQERFDPKSDEYYDELNKRLREAFPQKLGSSENNSETRPVQSVAPANRASGVNSARKKVRLTPSQVAIAKKLGVPLEEYAKYVK